MSESIETLTDLLERASARRFLELPGLEDFGYADQNNFPFLALVGQHEMKLALLLALINPNVGGVLLLGPRGTGKTTAVRSLVDLMPEVPRSRCHYGCMPEDIELGGIDAVCQDCAKKYGQDEPLTYLDQVQLIELPLNARLEDVVGGIDERAAVHNRLRLRKGLLARADRHLLYIDEVNLLADDVVDVILDAAAQGTYTVHRGSMAGTYRSRFVLIGSMNPEEGQLRPQILDRFGLRVIVRGLHDRQERLEAYQRSVNFLNQPQEIVRAYAGGTAQARNEIEEARKLLAKVEITEKALSFGLSLIEGLGIESLRAEITLFEAARAHAVADGRKKAGIKDIRVAAPLALRSRRSAFIKDYLANQSEEEANLSELIRSLSKKKQPRKKSPPKKRISKLNSG